MNWREYQIYHLAKEREELNELRRTRNIVHIIAQTAGETKSIYNFWKLPGDPVEKRVPLTEEEHKKIFSIYQTVK